MLKDKCSYSSVSVRWKKSGERRTIEEWHAQTHEQSDDDETETGAEWVYEGEPVYPSLLRTNAQGLISGNAHMHNLGLTAGYHVCCFLIKKS